MSVPERYWRFPTRAAIDSLAERFGLPNGPHMQDWEYEVSDPARLPEFLAALEDEEMTDDEQFALAVTVMQCFDDLATEGVSVSQMDEWRRFVSALRARPKLHAHTLCYWSSLDTTLEDAFRISALVRPLWAELEPAAAQDRE